MRSSRTRRGRGRPPSKRELLILYLVMGVSALASVGLGTYLYQHPECIPHPKHVLP